MGRGTDKYYRYRLPYNQDNGWCGETNGVGKLEMRTREDPCYRGHR